MTASFLFLRDTGAAIARPLLILFAGFRKGLAVWHSGRRGQSVWLAVLSQNSGQEVMRFYLPILKGCDLFAG